MNRLKDFLVGLLLRTPQEILVALLRLLLLLLVVLLVLLLKLWEWLRWLFRTKTLFPEETEKPCGRIPEVLVRRPDPSIYSQTYLAAQGLPVTWNNPDVWVAPAANPGASAGVCHLNWATAAPSGAMSTLLTTSFPAGSVSTGVTSGELKLHGR